MRKKLFYKRSTWIGPLIGIIIIASCTLTPPPPVVLPIEPPAVPPEVELPPEDDLPDPPSGGKSTEGNPADSSSPEAITFEVEYGRDIEGIYYPAAYSPAPAVVLMHWSGGDMNDWHEIALWLQNLQEESGRNSSGFDFTIGLNLATHEPWHDPSWFPAMRPEVSFNVVVFNLGGYGNNEAPDPDSFVQDAVAALAYTSGLEKVDPNQISTMGASTGADVAADGCYEFTKSEMYTGTCVGAFSISPGVYLGTIYVDVVKGLQEMTPPAEVRCLGSTGDNLVNTTCPAGSGYGDHYMATIYEGDRHGMVLLSPHVTPNPLQIFQQFLEKAHDIDVIPG